MMRPLRLETFLKTRLHSSRMRSARTLTISPSMLCAGVGWDGGLCMVLGGVHGPGVCVFPGGGAYSWGVHGPGGAWSQGGWYPSMHWDRPLPPVNRMINRCKNITLPQTSFACGNNGLTTTCFKPCCFSWEKKRIRLLKQLLSRNFGTISNGIIYKFIVLLRENQTMLNLDKTLH